MSKGTLCPVFVGAWARPVSVKAARSFGVDLIEMDPGSAFPLHVHPGDHILYVLDDSVAGIVHVDGVDYVVRPGDSIFIPAEYPHGVKTFAHVPAPLRFLAVGVPHKHVSATDRMRIVTPEQERR